MIDYNELFSDKESNKMKKESYVGEILFGIFVISLVSVAIILPLLSDIHKNTEITKEEYSQLAEHNKKYPTVTVLVELSLQNDNKVSNEEFRNIMKYVNGRDKEEELKKMGL